MFAIAAKTVALVAAIATAVAAEPAELQGNITTQAATSWDLYTFAQSWQPEFCYGHSSYVGCSSPNAFWKTSFTIHGLWPDVSSGTYPSSCTNEAFNLAKVTAAVPLSTLYKYWPNVKVATSSSAYDDFWAHEWSVHGTCTGLDQATYFKTSVNLLINNPTPAFVGNNYGKSVSTASLRSAYGGASQVILQCSGKYLLQILTCWTKGSGNLPTSRRSCPSNLLAEDNCSAATITIPAF